MEYLQFAEAARTFEKLAIAAREEGDELRLSLDTSTVEAAIRIVFGQAGDQDADVPAERRFERTNEELVGCVEGVLHRLHINEVALMPVGPWRGILDLAAFELASDERWLDLDAEAAMHMNDRDPLLLRTDAFGIMTKMYKSMLELGDSPMQDLILFSLETPFVMELRQAGGITVWCANAGIADEVATVSHAPE